MSEKSGDTQKQTASKQQQKKPGVSDTAAYGKTVGGKLKIKGVEMKTTKKKGETQQPVQNSATANHASKQLQGRINKKSDRYAMVTLRDDDLPPEN